MMNSKNCPVCLNKNAIVTGDDGGGPKIDCPRCGKFKVGWTAVKISLANLTLQQRANLSGWIREHQDCTINAPDMAGLTSLRSPSVGEKAQRLMLHLAKHHTKPGDYIEYPHTDELFGVCWAQDADEATFILHHYLILERKLIEQTTNNFGKTCLRITPAGWAYLDGLLNRNVDSSIGFIAIWFDKSVDPASVAIEAGIRNSGYEPLRIDRKEHNNKIDDEIVAGIRRSKFLVADFTGHRGGVYFETGFATGLGLPVIWLCRQDELEKTHFDTRQYNFIVWEADKLTELSKALQNRIEATIGRGPLTGNALS